MHAQSQYQLIPFAELTFIALFVVLLLIPPASCLQIIASRSSTAHIGQWRGASAGMFEMSRLDQEQHIVSVAFTSC